MSKVLFFLTFLATSVAFGAPAKPVECATSNGQIRYEGTETTIVTDESKEAYLYEGNFLLATPRSDRNYVIGDLIRDAGVIAESEFLADANILVVDGTPCSESQLPACTHVDRATTKMLCSYIQK